MTDAERTDRQIRAATLLWMGSVFLSRLTGLLREVVIARVGGATAETDVYFAAFTIPDLLNYLLAGGALSITFIPIFAGYLAEGREDEGWKVFSIITTFLAVVLGSGIVLAMIFADRLVPLVAPGFPPDQQVHLARLTRIVLPAQLFHFLGFLLSAVQMARGRHLVPALLPLVYNGGTILGGLLLGPRLGMEGFCWGLLAGAAVGSFLMQVVGARSVGLRYRPSFDLKHPGFLAYWRLSLPVMIGQSLVVWDEWLVRIFGSAMIAGTISVLSYARKLAQVPQAVFGQAAGVASYPVLARHAAEGRWEEFRDTITAAIRRVSVAAFLSLSLLACLAPDVCAVLLRNRRFDDAATAATAAALAIYALAIPAWTIQGLVSRGFYALRDSMTPTWIGTAATAASVPVYWLLGRSLEGRGLAVAAVVGFAGYTVVLAAVFRRRLAAKGVVFGAGLGAFLARLSLAAVLAAAAGLWVRGLLPGGGSSAALLRGLLGGAAGAAVFCGAALLFRVPEMESAAGAVRRRIRRRAGGGEA